MFVCMYVCDDDFEDDDFVIGQKLANLASSKYLLKDQMFRQIVQFRENRKNGVRKVAQLKEQFQKTFLQQTCTGDVHVDATMKKKCGKLWACIEYAIYEFVDISSFSCSHVERMRDKHNAWLSQKGKIENLRGEVPVVEETKLSDASESVFQSNDTVQRPLDDPVSASRRKSDRTVKPARSFGSEGKHQTYPKMM